jgi:carotenoid cleavage dioxygenase-like enzyme
MSLMWQKFKGKIGLTDRYRKETANTASIFHAGKFFALMEAQAPYWIVADQLKTKGR